MTDQHHDRLLLVDDNLTNLQVLYQALEAEGYELLVAQSGEEALGIARDAQPQLILLDISMPGIDGFETCRRLKADEATSGAVVIFLSARGEVKDKLQGFETGAVDYVEKPFQFEEVVARVRTHLAAYHRERELEEAAAAAPGDGGFSEFFPETLRDLIARGEDDGVEFKSTLRTNLHTGKPDKRIENACLKTVAAFLNSEGGLLLVGVNDDGDVLGLDADKFPNHDKLLLHLTSLISRHLGGELAPFVRATVHTVDGNDLLAVESLRSPHPVYFRRDDDEIFYVRTGPSTRKLSPSEVVAYVGHRAP